MKILISSMFALLILCAANVSAKRLPPPVVPSVIHDGVKYTTPQSIAGDHQKGGFVQASDAATGNLLWTVKVYGTPSDPELEKDVQDVFIRSLVMENGRLVVMNEKGKKFMLDPKTGAVTKKWRWQFWK